MVQTCIFDLYGTLVDIHTDEEKPEVWKKLALFFRYYGADYTPEELKEAYSFQVQKLTEMFREEQEKQAGNEKDGRLEKENGKDSAGKHSPEYESSPEIQMEEVFLRLYRERGVEADQTLAVHTGQFFRSLSTDYLRLYDGVESMLSELRQAGKKVYLLSNAQSIFTAHEIKALRLDRWFDGMFLSSDYGCKKPDLRFYEKLLATYGIDRETAVMIGNDGTCDIQGAKRAGLCAVYLHTNLSPEETVTEADAVIEGADMERLKELLLGSSRSNKEKVTEKESNKRENRKNLQKSKEKRKQP